MSVCPVWHLHDVNDDDHTDDDDWNNYDDKGNGDIDNETVYLSSPYFHDWIFSGFEQCIFKCKVNLHVALWMGNSGHSNWGHIICISSQPWSLAVSTHMLKDQMLTLKLLQP